MLKFPISPLCRLATAALMVAAGAASSADKPEKKVLVYTRNFVTNGTGYVHDNIAASIAAIQKMGAENGFSVEVSDDPAIFTDATLKRFKALIFSNSNNEAFNNDAQREAFKHFIQSGGGFVGIHSASGSERNWPYFWSVVGGKFVRHPKLQNFVVRVADPNHPATKDLPATFEWEDECYYTDHINPAIHPLLVTDPALLDDPQKATYPGDRFGNSLPLAWYQEFDGGREFYCALGHRKEAYSNPILYKHLLGGILWVLGKE